MLASVKGLAPVFFGLVFGRGFGGCLRAENSPQSGIGFVGQSGVQVAQWVALVQGIGSRHSALGANTKQRVTGP